MNVLRPSLLPGLLDTLRNNLSHQHGDWALFEVGRVFCLAGERPREEQRVAIALTGQRSPWFWSGAERGAKFDAYDLKGVIEEFLEQFGVRGVLYSRRADSTALYLESSMVHLGKQALGELGQLLPTLAKSYDLRYGVVANGTAATWTSVPVPTIKTAVSVTGLTPGTIYAFQVRALGKFGYTDWSDSATSMCT